VTPLYLACEDGNLPLAALLSTYGARRQGPPTDLWTAEAIATAHGHAALAAWLRRSAGWSTALHHVAHLSPDHARSLLRAGASLHSRAAAGAPSPLELATSLISAGEGGAGGAAAVGGEGCALCRARESAAAVASRGGAADGWVRCSDKFGGRQCRAGLGCGNRKCGFDHPRGWPHLKPGSDRPPSPPSTLPLQLAVGAACEECEAREAARSAARLVTSAAGAWCPETHALWPCACRDLAVSLLRLGWRVSRTPASPGPFAGEEQALMDVWRAHVIPLVLGERR